jgi:hypothetical protein
MKNKLSIILGGLLLFNQAAMAQTAPTITVSAEVPSAQGLQLTVTPVNATTNVAGTSVVGGTTADFGTLTFNSTLGIYTATNYYEVAIGTTGGAGTPEVNVTYAEGTGTACPNIAAGLSSTLGCLGIKSTATFATVPSSGVPVVAASLGKKRLIDLTGTAGELLSGNIPAGSYELVYLGVWTGSTTAPADPTNGKPFTNLDAGGTYQGVLTFTAVTL